MATERDRLLIGKLTGRGCLPDDINGVEGIEAGEASRPPPPQFAYQEILMAAEAGGEYLS
jgi:hypothetical protein